ncbi:hypothetical protein [Bacillus sp. B15-48]|uniref:hypothetical protein n=1 Tax=Bacillus sp. B15-48 TaxID=1548601 RepID=UPI00193FFFE6|nr:hypothetical protein [Bacillus sp. B15-48]MBM4763073.1 hypothetical protein [Bacillus sp. B15-48]
METSLTVFQDQLIDYAGLFPPAKLPLDEAINNFATYKKGKDAWMLGPFVMPVTLLKEVTAHMDLFSEEIPLTLSVVCRKSESAEECKRQFQEDVKEIAAFIKEYAGKANVDMLEVPLPPEVPTEDLLNEIAEGAATFNVRAFCEVSLISNWKTHVTGTLDAIEVYNRKHPLTIGVKLRTGGIKAEMFPSLDQVAFVIASCRDRKLAMKFTAGLHHPVRMYREEVQTKMHGFLNIFLSGMFALTENLDAAGIKEILEEEDPNRFLFASNGIIWNNYKLSIEDIKKVRETSLFSFGSCSFDEPKDELRELITQQGVTL